MRNTILITVLGLGLAGAAQAGPISDDAGWLIPNGPAYPLWSPTPVNLGMIFTANQDFTIDELGFYDNGGATTPQLVTLYDATGSILASTFVGLAPGDTGYHWQGITPVGVTAGQTYVVAQSVNNAYWGWDNYNPPPWVNPEITWNGSSYVWGTTPAFTGTANMGYGAYYGPNFGIPDGGMTAGLLGLGLAGLAGLRRRLS